jgi:hypothetical protein
MLDFTLLIPGMLRHSIYFGKRFAALTTLESFLDTGLGTISLKG